MPAVVISWLTFADQVSQGELYEAAGSSGSVTAQRLMTPGSQLRYPFAPAFDIRKLLGLSFVRALKRWEK